MPVISDIKKRLLENEGNALVLAVLILLSLTSVGIIGVQRTNTELMVAGNVTRAGQAGAASEAGMMHAMGIVGGKGYEFTALLKKQRIDAMSSTEDIEGATLRLGRDVVLRSTAIPEEDGGEQLFIAVDSDIEINRIRQDIAYQSESIYIDEIQGSPGSDVDSDVCQYIFDFMARGGIPNSIESVEDTLCIGNSEVWGGTECKRDTVVVESRARAIVGPMQCGKGQRGR